VTAFQEGAKSTRILAVMRQLVVVGKGWDTGYEVMIHGTYCFVQFVCVFTCMVFDGVMGNGIE